MRTVEPSAYGELLRQWRGIRGKSQHDLALEAGVSARHISFVETGRSRPSARMILRLAETLDVPLRDQNAMLLAAGLAPRHPESSLDDESMRDARRVLRLVLQQHEPFPAFVLDRSWNVVLANRSFEAHLPLVLHGKSPPAAPVNLLRLMLDPQGLRPAILNWEEAASAVLRRARRELRASDEAMSRLLAELRRLPDVDALLQRPAPATDASFLPLEVRVGKKTQSWITVIASFGTPQDVTLQELRIESLYPLDDATEELTREIALRARLER